jgi:uncharacterized membrane protein
MTHISLRVVLFIIWASGAIAHCYLFINQVKNDDKKEMEKQIPQMGPLPTPVVNSVIVFSVGAVAFFWPIFMGLKAYQAIKKDSV